MNRPNAWSEEMDARLKQMIDEGFYPHEVAQELGKSVNSIIGRAWRLAYNRWPKSTQRGEPQKNARQRKRAMPKPKPRPLPRKPAVERPRQLEPLNVLIWDLEPQHCRWPTEGTGEHMRYCGCDRVGKKAYCKQHMRVAWQPSRHAPAYQE